MIYGCMVLSSQGNSMKFTVIIPCGSIIQLLKWETPWNSWHLLEKLPFKLSDQKKSSNSDSAIGSLLESIWMYPVQMFKRSGFHLRETASHRPIMTHRFVAYCRTSIRMNTRDSATNIQRVQIFGHNLDTTKRKEGYYLDLSYQQMFIVPYQLTPCTFIWLGGQNCWHRYVNYTLFTVHVWPIATPCLFFKKDALKKTWENQTQVRYRISIHVTMSLLTSNMKINDHDILGGASRLVNGWKKQCWILWDYFFWIDCQLLSTTFFWIFAMDYHTNGYTIS